MMKPTYPEDPLCVSSCKMTSDSCIGMVEARVIKDEHGKNHTYFETSKKCLKCNNYTCREEDNYE